MKKKSDPFALFSCAGLERKRIVQLAFETGFCERNSRKIQAPEFLVQLCLLSMEGTVSYNDLAARLQAETGVCVSRQACCERTDESCMRFFQRVLELVMLSKCDSARVETLNRQGRFKRILLHDSTILKLPLRLFKEFSGVKNAHKAVCNARLQGVYDLLSGQFIHFSIDPYSKNDQDAAMDIPVQDGDLVLRDRGYFRIPVVAALKQAGADSINRYKHPTVLHDPSTGQQIDLLDYLTRNGSVDTVLLAGADKTVPIRLIAVPAPEETANLRRMRAKKEMKGHAPSPELLKLMSWTIFLTTITDKSLTFKEISALYGLRWRIENIFKTWKSYFSFAKLHNVSEIQLGVILTARLIAMTIAYERFFLPLSAEIHGASGKCLSLMKFMRFFTENCTAVLSSLGTRTFPTRLCKALERYCTYEKRRRANFVTGAVTILLKTSIMCLT